MSRKKVLVLGGNFGGLTAALAVTHELHGDVDVRVVSASERFLFNPSLIWLPFGKRRPADITFPLTPTFEAHGIDFVHAEVTALDLASRKVTATSGVYGYDYLAAVRPQRGRRRRTASLARPSPPTHPSTHPLQGPAYGLSS